MGGYGFKEVIGKVDNLFSKGLMSTIDILGEEIERVEQIEETVQTYTELIGHVGDRSDYVTISIKLSAFGILINKDLAKESLLKVLKFANDKKISCTLDMESSSYVDITLKLYRELLETHPSLGIVLQTRLFRTKDDILDFQKSKAKARVRLCIGIYNEPASIALTNKEEMKNKLVEYSQLLLKMGFYVECATHDQNLITKIVNLVGKKHIPGDKLEFQHLLGVPLKSRENELLSKGYKVRLYVPFALDKELATHYLKRRMLANPNILSLAMKNLFKRKK